MLIVAKLATKDDTRHVMGSCHEDGAGNPYGGAGIKGSCTQRSGPGRGAQKVGAPFKNVYNEGLASGACHGELADTGVSAPTLRRGPKSRFYLTLQSLSASVCVARQRSQGPPT